MEVIGGGEGRGGSGRRSGNRGRVRDVGEVMVKGMV